MFVIRNDKFVVLDLFCGAGGFSTGFTMADYDISVGIDFDKNAGKTYEYNHSNTVFIEGDINNITSEEILNKGNLNKEDIDCIIGGPPCQGFSSAGRRMIDDPRNVLYKNFVRIVGDISPKAFLMENVKGLTTMKKSNIKQKTINLLREGIVTEEIIQELREDEVSDLLIEKIQRKEITNEVIDGIQRGRIVQQIKEDFETIGYEVIYLILNAADYGVPQGRKRVFFIGVRRDLNIKPSFPSPSHNIDTYTTIRQTISDLSQQEGRGGYVSEPLSLYQALLRQAITVEDFYSFQFTLDHDEHSQEVTDHDIEFLSNETVEKMKEHKRRHLEKGTGFGMRFFDYDKVGYTLTCHFQSNYEMLHPDKERPRFFTLREGARIQGYPDSYIFFGSKQSKAKQIGNSVPILLAYSLAKHIKEEILLKVLEQGGE